MLVSSELALGVEQRLPGPDRFREVYGAWKGVFTNISTSTPPGHEDFVAFGGDNFAEPAFAQHCVKLRGPRIR